MAKKENDGLGKKPGKFKGGAGRVVKAHSTVAKSKLHDTPKPKAKSAKKTSTAKRLTTGHNAIAR